MNLVKLQGMKSIHRNDLLVYILIMRNQKEKESIPFTIATKRIKYLGVNLPKGTRELYTGNYDTNERNQRRHKQMERYSKFLSRKNQYCENDYITKRNL